jgi:tRNA pseudouridine55 synthase
VSAGTYIRALARDLGAVLGCGGALASLRRLSIAALDVSSAIRLAPEGPASERALLEALVPVEEIPLTPPPVVLREEELVVRFCHGGAVRAPDDALLHATCRVLAPSGDLLGIAEVVGGELRPRVVLPRNESLAGA